MQQYSHQHTDLLDEIEKLKGELATTRGVLAMVLHFSLHGDPTAVANLIDKLSSSPVELGDDRQRHSANHFLQRLVEYFPS